MVRTVQSHYRYLTKQSTNQKLRGRDLPSAQVDVPNAQNTLMGYQHRNPINYKVVCA